MSDSLSKTLKKPRIHFGSIEESLSAAAAANVVVHNHGGGVNNDDDDGVDVELLIQEAGFSLDEIVDDGPDSSETMAKAKAENRAILAEFERKKIARSLAVPTDDRKVRQRLKDFSEPQTYFGEGPAERRDRLRLILSKRVVNEDQLVMDVDDEDESEDKDSDEEDEDDAEEEFFYPGPNELLVARKKMAHFSFPRARTRLDSQRAELSLPIHQRKKIRGEHYAYLKTFSTFSSQFADERPLSFCKFSPNSRLLSSGSWNGSVKLWTIPGMQNIKTLRGHKDRISAIDFHPNSTLKQSPSALNLVSSAADGTVNLWSLEKDTPIGSLVGHDMRVARVVFHPSGNFIGTSSFDTTWRLWDSETQQELLKQQGHSREVFGLSFQNDGALVVSGGLDSIGRVWDLRTGQSIMILQGHVKPILSLDWSPNGYQLASGSEDNTIRIWDIRKAESAYTIPAHQNIVTNVKYWSANEYFENPLPKDWKIENILDQSMDTEDDVSGETLLRKQVLDGSFLISSSYDGTCKIWTEGDWKPIKALAGLEGKIMCCDVSGDGRFISTASYDRTFKLYASDEIVI